MRAIVAILLLAAAGGAAGCARDGDQATARAVTDRFFAALDAGDGARACEQLSPDTRAELESQEQSSCREAVTGLGLDGGAVVHADVYVLDALVELSNGQAAFLDEGTEGWRLSAVGCRTVQGKPADEPYDCEIQG